MEHDSKDYGNCHSTVALLQGMVKLRRVSSGRVLLSLCGLSLAAACSPQGQSGNRAMGDSPPAPSASEAREASVTNAYAPEAAARDPGIHASRDESTPTSGRATTQTRIFLARAKAPLAVLGRFVPGRLDVAGGCLTVTLAESGSVATPVFPPDARLVYRGGKPAAVAYAARTIAIGEVTRIPGGGSASSANLATALPPGCPRQLYPIGG